MTGGSYAYRSSKAGLNAVVKSLAIDLQPRHVLVLALHPGWAKTEPGARVDVDRSVGGMRAIIQRCGRHETGCFFAFNDTMLPW
jgi:NAD(P)-dependent dehydrogenase (short-subunit alcohol dehydrogenase family)